MSALTGWWRELLLVQGSTRAVGLIRIGLALAFWGEWAEHFLLFDLDTGAAALIGLSFYASTALMLIGYRSRFATAWAGLTGIAAFYVLGPSAGHRSLVHHHSYLLAFAAALLSLAPCGASLSLDRWLAVRRALAAGLPPPPERGELWATRLLALQVSALYFWSAVDKLSWGYLSGERLQQIHVYQYRLPALPTDAWYAPLTAAAAIGSVVLELALSLGLWFPRTRRWLLPAGALFHAVVYVTLPVQTFSVIMWVLYLVFLPPEQVHRVVSELTREDPSAPPPPGP